MKNIIFIFLFLPIILSAQINGNRNIITKNFPLEALSQLEINLTADIIIDAKVKPGISITTDENVIDYINLDVKNGHLDLTQLEWIEPTKIPAIVIGVSSLTSLTLDAHSLVEIKNLAQKKLKLKANIGQVILEGTLEQLDLKVKLAKVNAEQLKLNKADVKIKSRGKVYLGEVEILAAKVAEAGTLKTLKKPKELSKGAEEALAQPAKIIDENIRYIAFKLKNNSWGRKQFCVVGPKKDGSSFSYGFPMNPGQVRNKKWTVGSKVYRVNKLGLKKLVLTIKAEDEDSVVKMY